MGHNTFQSEAWTRSSALNAETWNSSSFLPSLFSVVHLPHSENSTQKANMMIGSSRPKTHIRRNSSMRGLEVSDSNPQPSAHHPQNQNSNMMITDQHHYHYLNNHYYTQVSEESSSDYHSNSQAMISPRNHNHWRTNSGGFDQSNFLRTCGLCRGRLIAGRDLYMYKGDAAFCSEECREEQMKRDGTLENY